MLKVAFPSFKILNFSGGKFPQYPLQVSVSGACLLDFLVNLWPDLHGTIFGACDKLTTDLRYDLRLSQRFKTCFKMLRHFLGIEGLQNKNEQML